MVATRNALKKGKASGFTREFHADGYLNDFLEVRKNGELVQCEIVEHAKCLHKGRKFIYVVTFLSFKKNEFPEI